MTSSTQEATALDQDEQVSVWNREQNDSQRVKQGPKVGNRSTNTQEENCDCFVFVCVQPTSVWCPRNKKKKRTSDPLEVITRKETVKINPPGALSSLHTAGLSN